MGKGGKEKVKGRKDDIEEVEFTLKRTRRGQVYVPNPSSPPNSPPPPSPKKPRRDETFSLNNDHIPMDMDLPENQDIPIQVNKKPKKPGNVGVVLYFICLFI